MKMASSQLHLFDLVNEISMQSIPKSQQMTAAFKKIILTPPAAAMQATLQS